ncbi:MAG: N-glycosylase/DNA lyase [Thermoplasmata archaeon]|nr:MAG: N-glycosylase/DNA lyase [Thermoplasmata archaeon]
MQGKGSPIKKNPIKEIEKLYQPIEKDIVSRLREFKRVRDKGSEKDIFAELIFCLLTPQSKAKSCDLAVRTILEKELLLKGSKTQIAKELRGSVRFHNTKAENIVDARKLFTQKGKLQIKKRIAEFDNPIDTREWLVANIKGMGYKEASHFLRNIGFGEELAILDRHILKNMKLQGVIKEVPSSLSKKRYLEIEGKMKNYAERIKIPMAHLDLLLWYKETGEIFK